MRRYINMRQTAIDRRAKYRILRAFGLSPIEARRIRDWRLCVLAGTLENINVNREVLSQCNVGIVARPK